MNNDYLLEESKRINEKILKDKRQSFAERKRAENQLKMMRKIGMGYFEYLKRLYG